MPVLTTLAMLAAVAAPPYDLVIRGGRIADGTGNPTYRADLAIKGDRIAAIETRIATKGKEEIDARGQVVAPGFIDVHTHAENVLQIPSAENFVRMGVTTLVIGNCGTSRPDLAKFFADLAKARPAVNVASLVGHNTVREAAMGGSFDRPPTADEMIKMTGLVDKAMRDGAVGLSTGLIYLPGTFAKSDEIVALAKVAAKYDGIYASHMRNESDEILSALGEVFTVAREAGIRAEISHIKLGKAGWGQGEKVIEAIERARAEGLDITQDQYVYTASSTSLTQMVPSWAREGTREDFRKRLADPALKARMVREMKEGLAKRNDVDYSYAVVASYARNRALNGKRVPEATKIVRGSDSLDDQIEFLLDVQANGGASGVFFGMQEEDLVRFMRHPNTMFASDSACREASEAQPHPRGYGNNARVFARYLREQKVLGLEEIVRKMTSLPATTFRLQDRGLLRPGMAADVVVFDPVKIGDRATYDQPHQYAEGFSLVAVNGKPVLSNQAMTGQRPGRGLRHVPPISGR